MVAGKRQMYQGLHGEKQSVFDYLLLRKQNNYPSFCRQMPGPQITAKEMV